MPSKSEPTSPRPASTEADAPENSVTETVADADSGSPGFGWTQYAERINGRFAMVGFIALLLLELVTGEGFFNWLGLR